MIKLFFVTDIHGSNVCYRKFLNALPIYGVDVAVLLGDLTGKVLVPLVAEDQQLLGVHPDGPARRHRDRRGAGQDQEDDRERRLLLGPPEPRGVRCTRKADPAKIDALFKSLVYARVQEWLDLADERLAGKPAQMFMAPGNDDWFVIDEMIDAAKLINPATCATSTWTATR